MKRKKLLPVRATMCATCPFRPEGWTEVRDLLIQRALNEATPICHSTGHALVKCQGKAQACRGARNLQLELFVALGVLEEPTDAAWEAKALQMGFRRTN